MVGEVDSDTALKSAVLGLGQDSVNVLIAYDEVSEGRRGMELFCALRCDLPAGVDLHCDLWRFDLIALPGVHGAAVLAARHSQVIVVATKADVDVPAPVKDWLDQSFASKPAGSAALVALLHSRRSDNRLASSPSRASLELMACRRKFQFFVTAAREEKAAPSVDTQGVTAVGPSATHGTNSSRPRHPPRWGINE